MDKQDKKKITLYLTVDVIEYLKQYSLDKLRSGSISEAVRVIAKEHEKLQEKQQ